MAVMGGVLFVADRRADGGRGSAARSRSRDALLIGVAQALALVPGVSRSGATISMALFLGYRREEAARFSFLLATPITFGAALLKVPHLLREAPDVTAVAARHGRGRGRSASSASACCSAYVRTRDYRPFVYYRWAFAALVFAVLLVRAGATWARVCRCCPS